ncbi:hypothetical protein LR48_Vigan09g056100 [Vigna angularis]|uniref:Uncharacterized protein n=1 Tax=Phaseolus angularis TaxID=3914 RepID=A0A0L9VAE7_PHAAN|nr:hypothetical protein LR48_Vigan09g056100 [Vigna angularis]
MIIHLDSSSRELHVAPAQLDSNAWASIQAFTAMCSALGITPTIPVFLHYFDVRPLPKGGWVSLTSVKDRPDFPYFPFIGQGTPRSSSLSPVNSLPAALLNAFAMRIVTKWRLVSCLPCLPTNPTSWLRGRMLDSALKPFHRKRKGQMEGERFASKKGRKEGTSSRPLPNGVFSPKFNMSDRTNFHMSSTHRALIEPLSESELTNAMVEMSIRVASLAWYLREFANRRGAEHVRAELAAEKKIFVDLQAIVWNAAEQGIQRWQQRCRVKTSGVSDGCRAVWKMEI